MLAFLVLLPSESGLESLGSLAPIPIRTVANFEKVACVMNGDSFFAKPVNARCDFVPIRVHFFGVPFTIPFGNRYNDSMMSPKEKYRLALVVIQHKVDEQSNIDALWAEPYGRRRTMQEEELVRALRGLHDTIERLTIPLLERNLHLIHSEEEVHNDPA